VLFQVNEVTYGPLGHFSIEPLNLDSVVQTDGVNSDNIGKGKSGDNQTNTDKKIVLV
jgi:hypothetical protein